MENIRTMQEKKSRMNTKTMVKIALLAAISVILSFIEFNIPVFPSFLKLDIADVPVVLGSLVFGPQVGIFVELIKNIFSFLRSSTGGIGDLANFIIGCSLVIPLSLIYRKTKTLKGYILGSVVGIIVMTVVACTFNYFVLIPAYSALFGAPIEAFVGMVNKLNPAVVDLKTMVILSIGPFNLLKGAINCILGYLLMNGLKGALLNNRQPVKAKNAEE